MHICGVGTRIRFVKSIFKWMKHTSGACGSDRKQVPTHTPAALAAHHQSLLQQSWHVANNFHRLCAIACKIVTRKRCEMKNRETERKQISINLPSTLSSRMFTIVVVGVARYWHSACVCLCIHMPHCQPNKNDDCLLQLHRRYHMRRRCAPRFNSVKSFR